MDRLDRRRNRIAETFLEMAAERGKNGPQITVVELCERADISRSAFYSYFENLESVLEWSWEYTFRPSLFLVATT